MLYALVLRISTVANDLIAAVLASTHLVFMLQRCVVSRVSRLGGRRKLESVRTCTDRVPPTSDVTCIEDAHHGFDGVAKGPSSGKRVQPCYANSLARAFFGSICDSSRRMLRQREAKMHAIVL